MVVETYAVIAVLRGGPEAPRFSEAVEADPRPKMSVVSYVAAAAVTDAARSPSISR